MGLSENREAFRIGGSSWLGCKKTTPQRVPKDTLECGGSHLLIPGTFCLGRPDPVRVPVSGCFGMDTKFESTHFPCFPHIYYLETNPRGCRERPLGTFRGAWWHTRTPQPSRFKPAQRNGQPWEAWIGVDHKTKRLEDVLQLNGCSSCRSWV